MCCHFSSQNYSCGVLKIPADSLHYSDCITNICNAWWWRWTDDFDGEIMWLCKICSDFNAHFICRFPKEFINVFFFEWQLRFLLLSFLWHLMICDLLFLRCAPMTESVWVLAEELYRMKLQAQRKCGEYQPLEGMKVSLSEVFQHCRWNSTIYCIYTVDFFLNVLKDVS